MLLINVRAVGEGVALVLANREVRDLLSFAHYAQTPAASLGQQPG
jgi:hypothetical protein